MDFDNSYARQQNYRSDIEPFLHANNKAGLVEMLDSFSINNCICEFRDSNHILLFDIADVKINIKNLKKVSSPSLLGLIQNLTSY